MADNVLRVRIDPSGAVAGAAAVNRSIDQIRAASRRGDQSLRRMESGFTRIKRAALGLGTVFGGLTFAGLFADTVRSIGDFELAMSGVQAVTNATTSEFMEMEEVAKQLGATTLFTAGQAAEGMRFLGQTGFDTNQIIQAIGPSLQLAVAGQLELAESADLASNVLKQFNLQAEETARVADVLANTAASSNTNVRQAGEAFKFAGPIASQLGLSIEETAAAIGVLGDAGIQASLAGTTLRQSFLSLTTGGSDKAKAAVEELGLTFDEMRMILNDPNQGIIKLFEIFRDRNITAEQAAAIFQRRAAAGALILAQNADRFRELTDANIAAEGEAQRMANTIADNLIGQFRQFQAAVEALQLSMGTGDEGLSGALRSILFEATGVIRVFAGAGEELGDSQEHFEDLADTVELVGISLVALTTIKIAPFFNAVGLSTARATTATFQYIRAQNAERVQALETARADAILARRRFELVQTGRTLSGQFVVNAARAQNLKNSKLALAAATERLAVAQRRASVTARGLAVASRGLASAFRLLGGPAGVIFLAAEALLFFSSSADSAAASEEELVERIRRETDSVVASRRKRIEALREETEAALEAKRAQLGAAQDIVAEPPPVPPVGLGGLGVGAAVVQAEIAAAESTAQRLPGEIAALEEGLRRLDESLVKIGEQEEVLKALPPIVEEEAAATNSLADARKRAQDVFDDTRTSLEQYNLAVGELNTLVAAGVLDQETAARAVAQYRLEVDGVSEAIDAAKTDQERLNEETEKYQALVQAGLITQEQATAAVDKYGESLTKVTRRTRTVGDLTVDVGEEIVGSLSSAARSGGDFGDAMKGAAASVVEMVVQLTILKPLLESLSSTIGGTSGVGGLLGAGLSGLFGAVVSGIGGLFGGGAGAIQAGSTAFGGTTALAVAAEGAFVKAKPGGTAILVGEGGEDEAIFPLSKLEALLAGGGGGATMQMPRLEVVVKNLPGQTSEVRERRGPDGVTQLEVAVKRLVVEDIQDRGAIGQEIEGQRTRLIR